jgi:hypothetical protein
MTVIIWSWRAILWSLITVAQANRPYATHEEAERFADAIVKSFDERFEIQASGGITMRKKS